jgi:hypothetical protein
MSRLGQLLGKPETVKLGEDLEVVIKPLKVKDLPMLEGLSSKNAEEQAKATAKLLLHALKDSIPDATEEEVAQLGVNYVTVLIEAISKVNGLETVKQG